MRLFSRGHRATASASNIHRYGTEANGSRNTVHASDRIDIEVNEAGQPIALWFRCLNLPYTIWRRYEGGGVFINPSNMSVMNIEYEEKLDA